MADDSRIQVVIELDDGSVRQGFLRVEKQAEESASNVGGFFKRAGEVAFGIGLQRAAAELFSFIKSGFTESIKAAQEQENAINKLSNSLITAGTFSEEAVNNFTKLADEIQRTTTVQDDAAISLFAYARNFTKTNEQAAALGKAAVDLSAQLGIGLEEAAQQIGSTFSGVVPRGLAKTVDGLKSLNQEQLIAGAGLQLIADRFRGAGEREALTFSGAILQIKNSINSLLAEIGSLLTRSPAVLAVFNVIKESVIGFTNAVAEFRGGNGDIFRPILESAINLGRALNATVVVPFQVTYNGIKIIIDTLAQIVFGFLGDLTGFAGRIITTFSPNSQLGNTLLAFRDFSQDMFTGLGKNAKEAATNIDEALSGGVVSQTLDKLDAAVKTSASTFNSAATSMGASGEAAGAAISSSIFSTLAPIQQLSGEIESLSESFTLVFDGFSDQATIFAQDAKKQIYDAGAAAFKGLAGGVASGMSAIGKALVKGDDIFQAFAGAMLSALGQAAIQMGSTYILLGLARIFASFGADATGYQLVGIGSAMAVAGGALTAIAGGGATSSSGGGYSPGSVGSPASSFGESQAVDEKAQQRVTVNIQGDVLDNRESALRIIELLNEGIVEQGAVITARA